MQFPPALSRFFEWRWSGAITLVASCVLFLALVVAVIPAHIDLPLQDLPLRESAKREQVPVTQLPSWPQASPDRMPYSAPPAEPSPAAPESPAQRRHRRRDRLLLRTAPYLESGSDAGASGGQPAEPRPPGATTQPFPEEARGDAPLPPMRVPPEMIGDPRQAPGAPGATAVPPPGAPPAAAPPMSEPAAPTQGVPPGSAPAAPTPGIQPAAPP